MRPSCSGSERNPDEAIPVELSQGDQTWLLATVDADDQTEFDETVRIPAEVEPASAALTATGSEGTAELPLEVAPG